MYNCSLTAYGSTIVPGYRNTAVPLLTFSQHVAQPCETANKIVDLATLTCGVCLDLFVDPWRGDCGQALCRGCVARLPLAQTATMREIAQGRIVSYKVALHRRRSSSYESVT